MIVKPARIHGILFLALAFVLADILSLTLSFPISFFFVVTLSFPLFASIGIAMILRPGNHPSVDTKLIKKEKLKFPSPKEEWTHCSTFDKIIWIVSIIIGIHGVIAVYIYTRM